MELNFVIPGWYKNKNSNSDVIETMRVLRGGDKSPNHFLLMDGREMHENEILDNWEFMPTSISQDSFQENFILGDIENNQNNIENENKSEIDYIDKNKIYVEESPKIEIPKDTIKIFEKTKQSDIDYNNQKFLNENKEISPEEIFVDQLLKQLSSEKQKNKFGETQFKSTFDIPIKFTFNYDLNKLKQILKLIDIDSINLDLFINKIITNDLNDINNKINEAIKNFILNDEIEISNKNDIIINLDKINFESDTKSNNNLTNTNNYLNNF